MDTRRQGIDLTNFDDFFQSQIEPLYAACIDPERLRRAKAQPWQFLWMFLAVMAAGIFAYWFWERREAGLMVFVGLLLLAEMLYLFDYPYPEHESIGFFVPFFVLLTGIGGFGFLYWNESLATTVTGGGLLVFSLILTLFQDPNRAALTRTYESLRAEVIDLFLKHLFPGFQWVKARPIYVKTLEDLGIFSDTFHEVETDEAIEGALDHRQVLIESIKLIRVTRDSKGGTSRSTVFKGFLMTVNPGRTAQPIVTIRPHRGLELRDAFVVESQRIELEDPTFENHFDVLCSDDFTARRLMTPALMARLSAFADIKPTLSGVWVGHPCVLSVEGDLLLFEGDFADQRAIRPVLKAHQENIDNLLEMACAF